MNITMFAACVVVCALMTIGLLVFLDENTFTGSLPKDNLQLSGKDAPADDGKVVYLTEDTFDKHVTKGKHFVKFYAPWCPWCYRLAPTFDDLAKELEQVPGVTVSEIDCTKYPGPCRAFGVKGYPLLLWIENGKRIEMYKGRRTLPEMLAFVKKFLGHDEL